MITTLNGEQREQLIKALIAAFPDHGELELLVDYKLNENIQNIAKSGTLEQTALAVVRWVEKQSRLAELIQGAQERNPTNSLLKQFVSSVHFKPEDTAITRALTILTNPPIEGKSNMFPANALLTSQQCTLALRTTSSFYREELFLAPKEAARCGVTAESAFAIIAIPSLNPGAPPRQYAVRLVSDAQVASSTVQINHNFAEAIGLQQTNSASWWITRATRIVPLEEAVIELVVESENIERERNRLFKLRQDLFVNRSLLIEKKDADEVLSLPILGRGYFNLRNLRPDPAGFAPGTVVALNEKTRLQLFVPHRKGGVDMVILVDASRSMNWEDFVDTDSRPHSRLRGVSRALDLLFQRRLSSGSRVSHLAIVAFGGNTAMLHPSERLTMSEVGNDMNSNNDMRSCLRKLNDTYLEQLLDRDRTNISSALREAADLCTMCCQDGNEKVFLLLSDGADWAEDKENQRYGEVAATTDDPAVLAEKLYSEDNIRIHTVSISSEKAFRRFIPSKYWQEKSALPNTPLLRKMASLTNGIFFESPDAQVLGKLFEELGRGTLYPLV
jgi:Effector-associated domain 1/von Willebrand factor type A domain